MAELEEPELTSAEGEAMLEGAGAAIPTSATDEVEAAELAEVGDTTEAGGPTDALEVDEGVIPAEEAAVLEASGAGEDVLAEEPAPDGSEAG